MIARLSALKSLAPRTSITCPQIRISDVDDFFEMFNSQNRDHTLDVLVEIWKRSAFSKGRNVSLSLEPKERTLTVSKLSQWLGFSEVGFKLLETFERATSSNN
jgi:ERCC4-type nuclease